VRGAAGAVPLAEVVPSARGGAALLGVSVPVCEPGASDRAAGEDPEWVGDGLLSPAWEGVLSLPRVGDGELSPACEGVLSPARVGEGLLSPAWEGVLSAPRVG
jgi:hypothetical protein